VNLDFSIGRTVAFRIITINPVLITSDNPGKKVALSEEI
jgi:hypothetical protein